uniref:RING-type domain-containing protein n=1 Tax=Guillardia theta TaxID=55529 RepID=A0A7S4P587_GUITH|mmetsp:Transcript_43258/g.136749  ORF Transcript_43258/g.136749 Transcript_43258/m.136749 type:complete len:344 (+) Transcript_43258:108-1139(+)
MRCSCRFLDRPSPILSSLPPSYPLRPPFLLSSSSLFIQPGAALISLPYCNLISFTFLVLAITTSFLSSIFLPLTIDFRMASFSHAQSAALAGVDLRHPRSRDLMADSLPVTSLRAEMSELHEMLQARGAAMQEIVLESRNLRQMAASRMSRRDVTNQLGERLRNFSHVFPTANTRRPRRAEVPDDMELNSYVLRGGSEETSCVICLENLTEGAQVTSLACAHMFHAACLKSWIRQKGWDASCPLCVTKIFANETHKKRSPDVSLRSSSHELSFSQVHDQRIASNSGEARRPNSARSTMAGHSLRDSQSAAESRIWQVGSSRGTRLRRNNSTSQAGTPSVSDGC